VNILEIKRKANDKNSKKKYKDYHFDLFEKFLSYSDATQKDVVVLGCSTGLDCQLFVLAGANKVVGIDLDPDIGIDYNAPNVSYLRKSITNIGTIADNSFDIVYSVAVFEHVFDIPGALQECKRLLKPGGVAYIISSPLWNSPFGHHYKDMLENYPWIHLVLGKNEAAEFLMSKNINEYNNKSIDDILDYIYHPQHFNHYPASYYEYAANNIDDINIFINKTSQQKLSTFHNNEFFNKAIDRGFSEKELLSSMHLLVFKKSNGNSIIDYALFGIRSLIYKLKRKFNKI